MLNAPAHTSATAGLMNSVTILLVFIPEGSGLANTVVNVPSNVLPKYWNTVVVPAVSKSKIVVTTGGGGRVTTSSKKLRTSVPVPGAPKSKNNVTVEYVCPAAGSLGPSMEGSVVSKMRVSHSLTLVFGTVTIQLEPPSVEF